MSLVVENGKFDLFIGNRCDVCFRVSGPIDLYQMETMERWGSVAVCPVGVLFWQEPSPSFFRMGE